MKINRLLILLTSICAIAPFVRADVYAPMRRQWLDKAIASTPELKTDTVRPQRLVVAVADSAAYQGCRDGIEESTAMQGLVIMALERTRQLALDLSSYAVSKAVANPADDTKAWAHTASKMRKGAQRYLYDKKNKAFVSGYEGYIPFQKFVLSQVWMVLADVVSPSEGADLLRRALASDEYIRLGSPYAHHFLVEAMIKCGMDSEARALVADYWGGMVRKGADTFWEVYDPSDDYLSPYKFHPVNSYCHAWSCTPAYLLRRYPSVFQP